MAIHKTFIPGQGHLRLPVGATILSVGFQRERKGKAAVPGSDHVAIQVGASPIAPADDISSGPGGKTTTISVTLRDRRSSLTSTRSVVIDVGTTMEDVEEHYTEMGFEVLSTITTTDPTVQQFLHVGPPGPETNLVLVLWFETPTRHTLVMIDGDGAEENYIGKGPMIEVATKVVPTGHDAPGAEFRFVGTVMRPANRNPVYDAVFHVYIEDTPLLRFGR